VMTVSMSPAAELGAARDEGCEVAVVTVVANAGDTTHEEVLAGCGRATQVLGAVVAAILAEWGVGR
jgi:purine nucleoside phosphorylase